MKKVALALALFVLVPVCALAQNTGLPPFGSLTSLGFNTVNNQDLDVYFTIPMVSSSGRGIPLNVALTNNSLVWVKGTSWTPVVDALGNPTWGWLTGVPLGGIVQFTSSTANIKCVQMQDQLLPVTFYRGYSYVDALGTVHPASAISFHRSVCPAQNSGTTAAYTDDHTDCYEHARRGCCNLDCH